MSKIREKLRHLKEKGKEVDLFPYLQQLFLKMEYSNVEITHGRDEYGKDLVFSEYDTKRKKEHWTAVVVKNKDASMSDFEEGGEIMRQINLSFKHPFKNSLGENKLMSSVIVVINGTISTQAKSVIEKTIPDHMKANLTNWNYQRLEEEINQHIKDDFLSEYEISFNNYRKAQIDILSKIENTNELFHDLTITDI